MTQATPSTQSTLSTQRRWAQVLTPADLGRFLRRLRAERDLTQDELADLLGVSRRYVYEIEAGKPSLYNERLFALLRVLGARLSVEADVAVGTGG